MKKFLKKLLYGKAVAFTLAEVLITLGVIGVVAAVTIPTFMRNYQEKVQKEQVRMVKYKLTQATSVMAAKGLIKAYPTTKDFVNELQKYLKISKVCDNNNLKECWPAEKFNAPNVTIEFGEYPEYTWDDVWTVNDGVKTVDVSTLKKGTTIKRSINIFIII